MTSSPPGTFRRHPSIITQGALSLSNGQSLRSALSVVHYASLAVLGSSLREPEGSSEPRTALNCTQAGSSLVEA